MYSQGMIQNFKSVFGPSIILWFFPCCANTDGNGFTFEVCPEFKSSSSETTEDPLDSEVTEPLLLSETLSEEYHPEVIYYESDKNR